MGFTLATSLLYLHSLLAICSVGETMTGENDTSSDSLDSALSLNSDQLFPLLCPSDSKNGHQYVDCSRNGTFLTSGNCAT